MTDALCVTIPTSDWRADFERQLASVAARMLGSSGRRLRLVVADEGAVVTIEPFFGSASCAALLSVGRELDAVQDCIAAIVSEAFRHTDEVGILARSERNRGARAVRERSSTLADAMAGIRVMKDTWLRIRPPFRVFEMSQVEAKLYQPLKVDSGETATHFLRDYQVIAQDARQAQQMVVEEFSEEGAAFVGLEHMSISGVCSDSREGVRPRIIARSGRIYFAES